MIQKKGILKVILKYPFCFLALTRFIEKFKIVRDSDNQFIVMLAVFLAKT